jgi:hypothetical protein
MYGKALIYRAGSERPEVQELVAPPELEWLQGIVGGYIEGIPHWDRIEWCGASRPCIAFCNENGKLDGLPLNRTATREWYAIVGIVPDVLVGDVVVLFGDREFMREL